MSAERSDDSARTGGPLRAIPAIDSYCDAWCERCRFQARCVAFVDRKRTEHELERSAPANERGERDRRAIDEHPISVSSLEYANLARGVIEALRPMVEARGGEMALLALEAIERHAFLIAVKARRAVSGLIGVDLPGRDADDGPDRVPSDADGTAELVRLLVAESREAWQVLMEAGRTWADGVPETMVRRLEAFDAAVAAAFPRAMAFVRPGFDDEPPG